LLGRRQARTVAGLTLALVLTGTAACSTNREVTTPPPVKVTDKLLAESTLTAEDLGEGFTAAKVDAPINSEILDNTKCDDRLKAIKADADASSAFENGDGVVVINQVAYLPGTAGNMSGLVDDLYDDCSKVDVKKDGVSIRTVPLDFGTLTDSTKAMSIEIESDSGPIQERDYLLMRKGDLVSVVRVEGDRPIDPAIIDRAVRVSIGNLGTLDNET
jgi:hypothetical protein